MAELALDDDQRHAFAGHLDGVGVPELVRREAPTDTRCDGRPAKIRPGGGAGPRPPPVGPVMTQKRGPTGSSSRSSSQGWSSSQPHASTHANLAAASTLAATDEQDSASVIQIGLGEFDGFPDA